MTWPIAKPRPRWAGPGSARGRGPQPGKRSAFRVRYSRQAGKNQHLLHGRVAARSPGYPAAAAPALDGAGTADRAAAGSSGAPGGGQAPTGGGTVLPCLRFTGGEAAGGVDRAGRAGWLSGTQASRHRPPAPQSLRSAVSVPGPGRSSHRGSGLDGSPGDLGDVAGFPGSVAAGVMQEAVGLPRGTAAVPLNLPALAALADQVQPSAAMHAPMSQVTLV
jgi:hypothetical protein